MQKYLSVMRNVAHNIEDIKFLKILIVSLAIIGPAIFAYYGFSGIIRKKTINLFRFQNLGVRESSFRITGNLALVLGIFYSIVSFFLILLLGPLGWFLVITQ